MCRAAVTPQIVPELPAITDSDLAQFDDEPDQEALEAALEAEDAQETQGGAQGPPLPHAALQRACWVLLDN
jgi:hypothetical protein